MFNIRLAAKHPGVKSNAYLPVAGADAADAVGSFMATRLDQCLFVRPENGSGSTKEWAYFALVEVEGVGVLLGRYFYAGIGRKGGVTQPNPRERDSLAAVERDLGLPEGELSDGDWIGEESAAEASQRRYEA